MTGSKGYIAKAVAAMNKDVYGGKLILLDWTRGYDLAKMRIMSYFLPAASRIILAE